jgi:acetylornithine deacetylase/succinyl-diaminopimelate desuccinylase-like protein
MATERVAREDKTIVAFEAYRLSQALILAMLFGVMVFLAIYLQLPPATVAADAPPTDFSSARALRHVHAIAQKPRPIGSEQHMAARDYIISELRVQGVTPQLQMAMAVNPNWGMPYRAATVRNIVARIGEGGEKAVLLVAHYDSAPTGPGANDDGVGVATLLETARALKSGPPLRNDVIFLFTDGEEIGLLGAQAVGKRRGYRFELRGAGQWRTGHHVRDKR